MVALPAGQITRATVKKLVSGVIFAIEMPDVFISAENTYVLFGNATVMVDGQQQGGGNNTNV
jgi:hypothetical protein